MVNKLIRVNFSGRSSSEPQAMPPQPQDRSIRRFKEHIPNKDETRLCSLSQALQGCASERAFAGGNKNQAFGGKGDSWTTASTSEQNGMQK